MCYKNLILIAIISLIAFNCVPRKKIIYLQKGEEFNASGYKSSTKEYQLKPNDLIAVNIFSLTPGQFDIFGGGGGGGATNSGGNNQTSNNANIFRIDSAGYVELPAIGKLKIDGLNISQAQDTVKVLLEDYLKAPLVRITLQTPFQVTLLGEVNDPGTYVVVQEEMNIFEAIGLAGDLTTFAERKKVKIVRENQDGTTDIQTVNLLEASVLSDENYQLQSNDLIMVDPLRARSARDNQLFLLSSTFGMLTSLAIIVFNLTRA